MCLICSWYNLQIELLQMVQGERDLKYIFFRFYRIIFVYVSSMFAYVYACMEMCLRALVLAWRPHPSIYESANYEPHADRKRYAYYYILHDFFSLSLSLSRSHPYKRWTYESNGNPIHSWLQRINSMCEYTRHVPYYTITANENSHTVAYSKRKR